MKPKIQQIILGTSFHITFSLRSFYFKTQTRNIPISEKLIAMHRAEQERLKQTTEKQHTDMVDIDREDADVEISAESDVQNGEIRNFWFQESKKFRFP